MIIDRNTKPGMYRTTKKHVMAKPDKRLRAGWLSVHGVDAGTEILVTRRADWREAKSGSTDEEIQVSLPGSSYSYPESVTFWLKGDHTIAPFPHEESATKLKHLLAIVADLEPTTEGDAILDWIEPGFDQGRAVLAELVHAGLVSADHIRTAQGVLRAQYDREERIRLFVRGWSAQGLKNTTREGVVSSCGDEDYAEACAAGWDLAASSVVTPESVKTLAVAWVDARYPKENPWSTPADDTGKWLAAEREITRLRGEIERLEQNIGAAVVALTERT